MGFTFADIRPPGPISASSPSISVRFAAGYRPGVPALVSSCDERVSSLSLGHGRFELAGRVAVHEIAGRPERVVDLPEYALRCADRLEQEFARAD